MRRITALLPMISAGVLLVACAPEDMADNGNLGPGLSGIRYLATDDEASGFERAIAPLNYFSFPNDHASHPAFRTEWWYFTGNVFDSDGRHYGFELTFFRLGLTPDAAPSESSLASSEVWMAHLAVTDTDAQSFQVTERLSRGSPGLAGVERSNDSTLIRIEDFSADFSGASVRLQADDAGFGIELELAGLDRIVAQGNNGLDPKGPEPGNASYYFSAPRLIVNGSLRSEGRDPLAVEGTAWLDREWGTSALSPEIEGWDWFALQLDDGRDLMFYRLRGRNGESSDFSGGSITSVGGSVTRLDREAVELAVMREWTSDRTGVRYPVGWQMVLPAQDLELAIRPRLDNQEIDLSVRYWEGAVTVSGSAGGNPIAGVGYLELAGY